MRRDPDMDRASLDLVSLLVAMDLVDEYNGALSAITPPQSPTKLPTPPPVPTGPFPCQPE